MYQQLLCAVLCAVDKSAVLSECMVIGSPVRLCSYHRANIIHTSVHRQLKLISQSTTNVPVYVSVCVCVTVCVCVCVCVCVRVRMESEHETSYELASSPGPAQKSEKGAGHTGKVPYVLCQQSSFGVEEPRLSITNY